MLANAFGVFVARAHYDALPVPVTVAVKLRVLDLLAAGLAGHHLGNHRALLPLLGGTGAASIWGVGGGFAPRDAALANSFVAHSTLLEDGSRYTGGHPSTVAIPGALAMAEVLRASGRELIVAVAAGYEIFLRLGRAIYPSTVERGFQSTAVLGAASSAASCASMLRLDAGRAANAIAIGCTLGVGLKQALKGTRSGALQVARSCEGGVLAAQLAKAGEQGAEDIIEHGLAKAFCDHADLAQVLDGLGSEFRIFETYLKRHAGCRGSHAPIDAIQELTRTNAIAPEAIAAITLRVDSHTLAGEVADPRNAAQARLSIAFAVALAVLDGEVDVFEFTDERLHDPRVQALMGKVCVEADPALDLHYPHQRGAWAGIALVDGRRYSCSTDHARGEPENPLGTAEIEAKFAGIATRTLGASHAARVRDLVLNLQDVSDVRTVTACLASAHAQPALPPGAASPRVPREQPANQIAAGGLP